MCYNKCFFFTQLEVRTEGYLYNKTPGTSASKNYIMENFYDEEMKKNKGKCLENPDVKD